MRRAFEDAGAATALSCFVPRRSTVDVTDVVHVATLATIQLRDAITLQGRGDVVAALDVEDVRSTFLDEVVLITQQVMVELGEGSSLQRELAAIKADAIGRAASSVIAGYDEWLASCAETLDTLDTTARG